MNKTKNAVKYMIDVWDEVTGKTWRQRPDHVQQKFLEAEKELTATQSTTPVDVVINLVKDCTSEDGVFMEDTFRELYNEIKP